MPPKGLPATHSYGVSSQVGECLVRLCHQRWRPLAEWPPGLSARWKGSTGTLKSWLTQATIVGRTPWGERGILGPAGLLKLPGEDWSPPGKRPRNCYSTHLDGQRHGEYEREKIENYQDWEATKSNKRILEESCESLIVCVEKTRRGNEYFQYHVSAAWSTSLKNTGSINSAENPRYQYSLRNCTLFWTLFWTLSDAAERCFISLASRVLFSVAYLHMYVYR